MAPEDIRDGEHTPRYVHEDLCELPFKAFLFIVLTTGFIDEFDYKEN